MSEKREWHGYDVYIDRNSIDCYSNKFKIMLTLVINGYEWRGYFFGDDISRSKEEEEHAAFIDLEMVIKKHADGKFIKYAMENYPTIQQLVEQCELANELLKI